MHVPVSVIDNADLPGGKGAHRFDGSEHGAEVSFFLTHNAPGTGPELHKHPYEETFIVLEGTVELTAGDEKQTVHGGQIAVVPAETPHSFVCVGPESARSVNIHPRPVMQTEWL